MYGTITPCGVTFQISSISYLYSMSQSYNLLIAETIRIWALPRSIATTKGITIVFSSSGYLDVSVPRVCPLITQGLRSSTGGVAPFGYLRI